jgi:hypothetical protein
MSYFWVYMVDITRLLEAFKDSGDDGIVNAYGLGNFFLALSLSLVIDNVRYFGWSSVGHYGKNV